MFNWFTSIRNLHSFDTGRFKPLQALTRLITTKQYLNNFTIRYFKSILLTNGMNTCKFFFRRSLIKTKHNRIIMITSVTKQIYLSFCRADF